MRKYAILLHVLMIISMMLKYTMPFSLYLKDPKNNRVQQHLKVKPMFGVYTDSFQLSTLTNLGDWKIEVEQGVSVNE